MAKAGVAGDRRVVVLFGADRMTEQAAQSALKLVEEPPDHAYLVLTAEDPARLLPTLVSRCQRLRLSLLSRADLVAFLTGELSVAPAEAGLLAALSGGSLGQALEARDSGMVAFRDRVLKLFVAGGGPGGSGPDPAEAERRVQSLERDGGPDAIRRAGQILLIWYHDLLSARFGLPEETLANADLLQEARREGAALRLEEIGRRLRIVEEMLEALDQNVNPALALHLALGRLASPNREDGFPG
jgi:DNA polymerase-3 subunit delta'